MMSRRRVLAQGARCAALLASAGVPLAHGQSSRNEDAFAAKSPGDAARAFGAGAPVESREVTLVAPEIAENGALVPITLASSLPAVKRLLLLVERNPYKLAAAYEINDAVQPSFAMRIKMGRSSKVYAVAITADNKAYFAQREITVTQGGCAG